MAMQSKIFALLTAATILFSCDNQQQYTVPEDSQDTVRTEKVATINTAELTLKSTVAITMQDKDRQTLALGSGTIIGTGMVITNMHVIAGASYGFVQLSNDAQKHAIEGYMATDKVNDLALLSVPTIQTNGLRLQVALPNVGDQIFAAGNPQGLAGTFSDGIVSSHRQFESKELIQISAPISPGSSGGPIVNANAELLGIAVGGFMDGQNLNFAIPSKYVAQLLNNKRELASLNVPKEKHPGVRVASKKVQTDLREAVKVRNLTWFHDERIAQGFGDPFFLQDPNTLNELSILNNLDYPISNIKLFFILYDRTATPVDYGGIEILPNGNETIMPRLAKTFTRIPLDLDKKIGYRCEVRLLDFKIHSGN